MCGTHPECVPAGQLNISGVTSQLDAALVAAIAGIAALVTPALEPLASMKRSGARSGSAPASTGSRASAVGLLRIGIERIAVSYLLPVAVPAELRQPGAEQLTEAILSVSIAEAAADVDVTERTADCSVNRLQLTHAEAGPSGSTSSAASDSSAAALETGADYARRAWDSRSQVPDIPANQAQVTAQPEAAQLVGASLLHVRFLSVLLRRTKRLVWAPGSAPTDQSGGGRLGFDASVVDPVLSFSTDAAFAVLALAVEVSEAVTLAKAQPAMPVVVSSPVDTAPLPDEVKQATAAVIASAGDAIQRAHRDDGVRGSVRVLGTRVQLPLNDGYTWTATVRIWATCDLVMLCRHRAILRSGRCASWMGLLKHWWLPT